MSQTKIYHFCVWKGLDDIWHACEKACVQWDIAPKRAYSHTDL